MKKENRLLALLLAAALIVPVVPGKETRAAVLTDAEIGTWNEEYSANPNYKRVSVHDPSVVTGYYEGDNYSSSTKVYGEQNETKTRKKMYFIFGTHRSFAYSSDLKNWNSFRNNLNNDGTAREIFKKEAAWSARGDSVYSLVSQWSSNLWAPDAPGILLLYC